jgi:endonuclease I
MTKRFTLLTMALCCLATAYAQGPNNSGTYYSSADGKKGTALKTAMFNIIKSHTQRSYDQLYDDYKSTDVREDGKIWDMYSGTTNFTPGTDENHTGGVKSEGIYYNREHSFPSSWFSKSKPMYTDLVHVIPTDSYVNNMRSNWPYGETDAPTYQSNLGFSKLGPCKSEIGYSGKVFEPNDEYKGDFARIYFYMATCYEDKIASWSSEMLAGNKYPAFTTWALNMLLRWAEEDPVSEKELDRNEAVNTIQHNRNPFVDYPGLEQYIWGSKKDKAFSYDDYDNDTPTYIVEVEVMPMQEQPVYNLNGQRVNDHQVRHGIYIKGGRKYLIK